jgi:hypothetical protein
MRLLGGGLAAAAGLLLVAAPADVTLPVDTKLQIRLQTKVSSASKAGDKFQAVVIAPVVIGDRIYVPAGSQVAGVVKAASASKPDTRAELTLDFQELVLPPEVKKPLSAKVTAVDNARESVQENGTILGILDSETLTAQMDRGLEKLGAKYSRFADLLSVFKGAVLQKADTEIAYEPGVEMELSLTKALEVAGEHPLEGVAPISPAGELDALVNSLPFQTTAENPPKPSDLTNLMYIGSREQIAAAFAAAGWSTAEQVNARSGLETFRAIAEQRGYKEAPMSTLLLEGQKPDVVFQKQFNTFAKRHHLRIFHRPEKFQGREVWVCAATHDIGIDFSPENRTFIHKIDSQIDTERAKVVFDLIHTGKVEGIALVDRPNVPKSTGNATGDKIETDGRMAVLMLE